MTEVPERIRARRDRSARRRRARRRATGIGFVAAVVLGAGALAAAGGGDGDGAPAAARLPPAPAVAPAVPRRAADPDRLTIAASGDLLIHSPVWLRAARAGGGYDFRPMFAAIRPVIARADLAVCHVETPMSPRRPPSGYPVFNAPPALARAIAWTGWDACSTASNHSLDGGQAGVRDTLDVLDRAGVRHSGTYRRAAGRRRALVLDVRGVRVALLSYTETTNGFRLPRPFSVALARAPSILADARRARSAGADVVVVNLHWGTEYQAAPSRFQRRLAARLTRSGTVTAVVGQHAHRVQPIRWINGRPVVFGEGNLLSNQTAACCPAASQDGLVALLDLREADDGWRVARVRYVPTWVRHPDFSVRPAGRGVPAASYRRTVRVAGRGPRVRPVRLP